MTTELEKIDPAMLDDAALEKFEEYRRRKQRIEEHKSRRGMSDEEAYLRALADPDNPPLELEKLVEFVRIQDVEGETHQERLRNFRAHRGYKKPLLIPCDADMAHWYAKKGPNYKELMNNVLRAHMEAEIGAKKAV